jgi:fatty-acyl-CoA synthase
MGRDLSIGRWICDRARATPGRVAIEFGGRAVTYAELHAGAHAAAARLRDAGEGGRVAVLSANRPEYVALVFGAAMAGALVVPLNWRQSPAELAYQLDDSEASWLVAEDELEGLARDSLAAGHRRPDLLGIEEVGGGSTGPPPACGSGDHHPVDGDTPLFVFYTSGTTGKPKGAVLSHANVFWANLCFDRMADVGSGDVVLQVLPQFHVGGWNCQPLLAWWKGATVVLERAFDPARVLESVAGRGITTMMGVPANYQFLAAHERFGATDLSSLRYVLVGGAPMPETLIRRWQDRGVRVVQGYGLTEAAPNVLCLPAEDASRRVGFAGKPYPHVDVALRDPESGAFLEGPGTGELVVRGPNVFLGYWRNPEATAQAMRDGWLRTGDVAERDDEGFYRIKDRIKDMYISGGENVYPAEVETVLASHPAIAEAAVIAVPDDRWGEAGLAVVVLSPSASVDEEGVRAWCSERLGHYKVPRDVRFVDALPRSAMNKVQKTELRKRFGAGAPA